MKLIDCSTTSICSDHRATEKCKYCAINPTNLKVALRNVGPVIKKVAGLCVKIPNKLQSRSAVDNFNNRKIAISQMHLGSFVSKQQNITFYTDETRKYGHLR